ncbi:thioredoxin-dependent thiol peroxidase [Devosia sp. WQ 349]|uniref:thioredoxin-dependent thiol peroxidase n=1 Tax=Devosia sp. WQ 349K1 TaxID=2800329 RepID=UPI0019088E95|nr:thioredoxin-dependent thiol peroxidase [Devosia sp. WQ 349K1]MBK1795807.1 thioredoxin-dependent thiol peroxidase [Devosia sp. WQ 349K1]
MTELKIGDAAPDFAVERDDGTTVSLADFKGQPVVVYFYPKDNTPGCTTENKDFCVMSDAFAQRGAVLLGVSPDTVSTHQKFRAKHELNLPLGADPERKMIEAFGVWQLKKLYGKEFMGLVRTSFIIDGNGKIARIIRATKVAGHAEKVLAELDAVLTQ